jgi:hypothetical protein
MRRGWRRWRLRFIANGLVVASLQKADVAELADALDSKSSTGNSVWVRSPPSAECGSDRRCKFGTHSWVCAVIGVGTTTQVAPPSEPGRPISGTRLSS